jgi:zinc/manganese transport system permease protein
MLPAIASRHWSESLAGQVRVAVLLACASSIAGLILSYNLDIPAGPAIVLTAGGLWLASLLTGPQGSLWRRAIYDA